MSHRIVKSRHPLCPACGAAHAPFGPCEADVAPAGATLAPRCERCGFCHGPGRCLKVRVLPSSESGDSTAARGVAPLGLGAKRIRRKA